LAWACVLIPDAGVDPARLVQLSERAGVAAPRSRDSLGLRGAALCRAAKWEEAVAVLNEALALADVPAPADAPGRGSSLAFGETAYEMLFLAMAHHHLGHADEARQWLEKAVRWMEQAPLPKTERGADNPRYSWSRRLAHEVLRREVELLLNATR
jgi:hypothetical protein